MTNFEKHYRIEPRSENFGKKNYLVVYDKVYNFYLKEPNSKKYKRFNNSTNIFSYVKDRFTAVLGPNTNQWWVYDEFTDEYCDPPAFFLNTLKEMSLNEQEERIEKVISKYPDWLDDKEYRYKDIGI